MGRSTLASSSLAGKLAIQIILFWAKEEEWLLKALFVDKYKNFGRTSKRTKRIVVVQSL